MEGIAGKARALAVERPARVITITALGLGVALLVIVTLIFLCVALFRLLAAGLGVTAAYAVFGGLFLAAGWFCWRKRNHVAEAPDA